jgi:hypothetical protein
MSWTPIVLGLALGAGVWLGVAGLKTLMNKSLDDAARKRGFWPLNGGLILIAVSMYFMVQAKAG